MIRLAPYLVKAGHFKKVSFVFFVAGHTKNDVDKRFNNLKCVYNKSNLYTMQQLVQTCNRNPFVTAVEVDNTVFFFFFFFFFNYTKLFDSIYKKFQIDSFLKYQMFLFPFWMVIMLPLDVKHQIFLIQRKLST